MLLKVCICVLIFFTKYLNSLPKVYYGIEFDEIFVEFDFVVECSSLDSTFLNEIV